VHDTGAPPRCPLCTGASAHFHRDRRRDYYRCGGTCGLVFVPRSQHLDAAAEKAVYDRHQNRPDDPAYRRFLSRLFDPLVARLPPGARGLDFGSGPGPTLSVMLEESGFPMRIYDPFYAPDPAALDQQYDFITATEVFEHLAEPGRVFRRLVGLLEPGGWLGVMTKRVRDRAAFARWHYILDPTHVSFFGEATFAFLAARHRLEMTFPGADTVLFRRGYDPRPDLEPAE
jgi:SAM-dependent methyltransferase